jgi:hypothetical protein
MFPAIMLWSTCSHTGKYHNTLRIMLWSSLSHRHEYIQVDFPVIMLWSTRSLTGYITFTPKIMPWSTRSYRHNGCYLSDHALEHSFTYNLTPVTTHLTYLITCTPFLFFLLLFLVLLLGVASSCICSPSCTWSPLHLLPSWSMFHAMFAYAS